MEDLEEKMLILKEIKSGKRSLDDLHKAVDDRVVCVASLRSEKKLTSGMLTRLDKEKDRLYQLIQHRQEQISKLRAQRERNTALSANKVPPKPHARYAPVKTSKIYNSMDGLVADHLSRLLRIPDEQIAFSQHVLRRLIEVSLKGEQLIVPENTLIVKYLLECDLVHCESAGPKKLRVRIL